MPLRIIEVYPNPYSAVDKDGVPQGVVGHAGNPNIAIGAQLDLVASRRTGKSRFFFPLGEKDGRVRVELTPEIAASIRAGELIAADKEGAKAAGIVTDYLEPKDALAKEKERALEERRAALGKEAKLEEIPREAVPDADDPELARKELTVRDVATTGGEGVRLSPTVRLQSNKDKEV